MPQASTTVRVGFATTGIASVTTLVAPTASVYTVWPSSNTERVQSEVALLALRVGPDRTTSKEAAIPSPAPAAGAATPETENEAWPLAAGVNATAGWPSYVVSTPPVIWASARSTD